MKRRDFLARCGVGLAGAELSGCASPRDAEPARIATSHGFGGSNGGSGVYIPGYRVIEARIGGISAATHPMVGRNVPASYDGPLTLLTRLGLEDALLQAAVFPVQGHVVSVAPDRSVGILHTQSHTQMISFDPTTLDVAQVSEPLADEFVGGGHTAFLDNGSTFAAAERAPYGPSVGPVESHYGRITIRDAATLQVIESYNCHGVGPHDLRLLEGFVLMVANYGSTQPPDIGAVDERSRIIEPSVALIDLNNGRLLDKLAGAPGWAEIRHAAVSPEGAVAAIQVRVGSDAELGAEFEAYGEVGIEEKDRLQKQANHFLPAAALFRAASGGDWFEAMPENPLQARHGLSIAHDPVERQFLATYPSSHVVVAFDETTGAITRVNDVRRWGLQYPCGLALHPDGETYLVAGAFADLLTFTRADHKPVEGRCYRLTNFQHSHIAVA